MNALLTRDETMFAAKLNAIGEASNELSAMHTVKLRSGELAVKC